MKKVILSLSLIVVFLIYIIYRNTSPGAPVPAPVNTPVEPVQLPPISNDNNSSSASKSLYKDGSYTGQVADAIYGNLQVKAIIKNGQITDVQFLQYPNDRPTSQEISQMSMPKLKTEAIQVQSSNVDVVSGATQTSEAFNKSLASALAQAKN